MIGECKEYFKNGTTIYGQNLGSVKGNFNRLSEQTFKRYDGKRQKLSEERKQTLRYLENFTDYVYSKKCPVSPMQISETGKVIINDGTIFHRGKALHLEEIKNYAIGGILASEWFGHLESEAEGRFCAFLSYTHTFEEDSLTRQLNQMRLPNQVGKIVFYFDEQNPVMQKLLSLDYFTYIDKVQKGEDLSMYSPQYKKLIDTTIAPLSPCGKTHKSNVAHVSSQWLAIPGGVPPFLINGIAINSGHSELVNNLEQIQKMFPNATIFDENQQVYGLQSTKEDTETKTDTKTTATNNMSQERVQ